MNKEPIGIVILNYRTWEKTLSCVESIYNTYVGAKEIVIDRYRRRQPNNH